MAPPTLMPRLSVKEVDVNFGSGFLIFLDQNSMVVAQLVALAAGPQATAFTDRYLLTLKPI